MKNKAFLFTVIAIFMAAVASSAAWSQAETGLARITVMEGSVSVNGRQAAPGRPLNDGDLIATGKNSLCEIVFADKNILRLGDETSMIIAVTGKKKSIEIVKGAFSALARRLNRYGSKKQIALSINTPTAICGVRGTAFFVRVEDNANSYICLCNGKMQVSAKGGGQGVEARAAHHKAFRLTGKAGSVKLAPAEMIYHTDADMESLAGAISEKMDWTRVEE